MPDLVPTENAEQIGFVFWFRERFPDILIYASQSGARVGIRQATKLSVLGMVAGVPDLFIPEWNLFIEMKRVKGGVLSKAQKELIGKLERIGKKVIVAKGARDASIQVLAFISARMSSREIPAL